MQGVAFGGAVIWNSEMWPLLAFALQNGFGGNLQYVITPQVSVLFVTIHGMVWYGMVNVDLCTAVITKVSIALNTLVSGEKPGFRALSKGLVVLLCAEVVWQRVPDHGAVHSQHCNHKNIECRSDWRGRQHRRLPQAANTLMPPLTLSFALFCSNLCQSFY